MGGGTERERGRPEVTEAPQAYWWNAELGDGQESLLPDSEKKKEKRKSWTRFSLISRTDASSGFTHTDKFTLESVYQSLSDSDVESAADVTAGG